MKHGWTGSLHAALPSHRHLCLAGGSANGESARKQDDTGHPTRGSTQPLNVQNVEFPNGVFGPPSHRRRSETTRFGNILRTATLRHIYYSTFC